LKSSLTVIILTYNEAIHLERCIQSVKPVADRIVIVDSYSTDKTLEIAQNLQVEVFQNKWINYAQQFQWALDNIPIHTEWIMRMDADEYIYPELARELAQKLPHLPKDTTGLFVKLRLIFMDQWIRRGYYPMVLLRFWRNGAGYIQQKWMDEHIRLKHGHTQMLANDMADHNLNNLSWWTTKHNNYATREAIDRLNREYHFLDAKHDDEYVVGHKKKWYKSLYMRLPLFLRPFLYFFYRYVLRGGFLEGRRGLVWHLLQGFWFQFLVDAKIFQIKHLARQKGKSIAAVLTEDFDVKLPPS
jgi:glycosyltransferase involved in cell wall biosynthesis